MAVSYFDRFIAARFMPARSSNPLAAACLLLASKIGSSKIVSPEVFAQYSEPRIEVAEILVT